MPLNHLGSPKGLCVPECVLAKFLSCVRLFVTLWTVAHQAPRSMGFSRQEYGVGCHAHLQGNFLTQGSNLCVLWLLHCRQILYRFIHSSVGKESACSAGDPGSILGLGRSPGEGIGYPLQYSGLENSMNCRVSGATKSRTRLSNCHFLFHFLYLGATREAPKTFAPGFKWNHLENIEFQQSEDSAL